MVATKIVTIVGARPQFVKAAVVSRALSKQTAIEESIIHTGQHFDTNMSKIFFEEMGIPVPALNLEIGGGTHGENTGRMIEAIEAALLQDPPDAVLVYGDTDSTLAGAIAAAKLNIPIAHVEAGLRSFNRTMPEEINRVLTDHTASILFAPSQNAEQNLMREGISGEKVNVVGDVMFDAVRVFSAVAREKSKVLSTFSLEPRRYVLATLHRKENTDHPARLSGILEGLAKSPFPVVLPLHPRTKRRMTEQGVPLPHNVLIVDPVGYLDMMSLEANAVAIATDSGGVQKEAYFHGVPCITMRDETEWTELVKLGVNTLVGADPTKIANALNGSLSPIVSGTIYGNGNAADKIAEILARSC